MKISDVIRTRRQALGLTQEALAERLGVSGPAVNKWEKSLNYPDITLLPTLARRRRRAAQPPSGWRRRNCGSFPAMTIWPSAPPGCWRGF